MASWFGSFAGGFAKGMSEQITKKEEDQAALTANSIANMYHNVQAKKKEMETQKEAARGIVSELGSFTFKDGKKFDDRQLITLASNPEMSKDIIKRLRDDPELSARITPDFFKAAETAPTGVKAADYLDNLFKVPVAAKEQTQALFNAASKEGGLVDKLVAQNGYAQAAKAAAKYGMSLEQLVGYQSVMSKRDTTMIGDVDYSKLAKSKTMEQVESDAQVSALNATTPEDKQQAANKLAQIKIVKAATDLGHKKTEEDIRSDLVNQAQDPTKSAQERALAAALVQQRVKLMHNPKENNEEKVTQANLITIASRGFASTVESLAPGKFITSSDLQGNITITPKGIADNQMKTAYAQSRNAIINEFTTPDGMPKSVTAKNALISIGVTFDQNGKAVQAKPENVLMGGTTTPATAAPASRGGPTQPKPATPAVTPTPIAGAPTWNPITGRWE